MRGQKCLKRGHPVGEWSRGARSMPRVFGRGSRSQPAALVRAIAQRAALVHFHQPRVFGDADLLQQLFETVVRRSSMGEGLIGGDDFAVEAAGVELLHFIYC